MNRLSVFVRIGFGFAIALAFGPALAIAEDTHAAPTATLQATERLEQLESLEKMESLESTEHLNSSDVGHGKPDSAHAGNHGHGHAHIGEKDVNKDPGEFRTDLAIFSALVFGLLAAGLYFTAWPQILGALAAREEGIRKAISDAEDAKVQAQAFLKEHKGRLEAVENQVKEILAEARRDAEHTRLDITKQAEVDAEAIKNRAIAEINRAKDQALDELFSTLAHQVSKATEQVVGRALTGTDQERLIQEAVGQFARQKA